ncbi:RagB/SusD family nutrient uptake outer membrane protein [Chitinophaga filiformis]|uniref:Starch-binding associating with outer membrane n=1 Tax=Chitinophaga filiformis TaxID=104663 RepID=A0A1G7NPM3_CHIFI|nr:RagB/SusD family nutrient uptake outer membrane protein [Chitinophaga filiformis]SDF75923.1 Starch-binding associating with outer membrane [Chitinophaga filiformis]
MKHFKAFIVCIIAFLFNIGCRKFVELDPPATLLVTENVFQRDETANAALSGLYTSMVEQNMPPFLLALYTGLYGDELNTVYVPNRPVYQNGLRASDAVTNEIWSSGYKFIYQANSIYEGCMASKSLNSMVKKQVMAEAIFIRAFWNFYLVNLYGDIPLVTTTNYSHNETISRSPVSKVYDRIISDLVIAQSSLNENYVGANSISTVNDRVRPNKATATALLARTYLYVGNYTAAAEQATLLIENSDVYSLEPLNQVFLIASREAIWQLAKPTPTGNINTYEGSFFILTGVPQFDLRQSTTVSSQLVNSFDAGDKRKDLWIGTYTDASMTPSKDYYFPYKYKVDNSADVTEYTVVLRLAEQYLIRAEARAQQNDLNGAISDLDKIRERAGIPPIASTNPTISKDNLLIAILKERQRELFAEWGHRLLDLKRTKTLDAVMTDVAPSKGAIWNATKQLWPIPQAEIGNDPNLTQNTGYN